MNKRGYGMLVIVIVAIIVIALLVVGVGIGNTGKATLGQETKGANYGPIDDDYRNYINCVYVGVNDGWDVSKIGEVKFLSMVRGVVEREKDKCASDSVVHEYNCEDGFRKERNVNCPLRQVCEEGICVNQ